MDRNTAALRRLVARHPSLSDHPGIQTLLSKGSEITDQEIVSLSQDLLLRPALTVATAGCFRHLLPHISRNLVDFMHDLQGGRKAKDDKKIRSVSGATDISDLIEHESAVVAFSRILELAPYTLSIIVHYFSFAPAPFQVLVLENPGVESIRKDSSRLLGIVRASYCLILNHPSLFRDLWDWSPFLDLLLFNDSERGSDLSQNAEDIRWCAVQILSIINEMSDEATRELSLHISGLTEEVYFACFLRWEESSEEIALEKAGWFVEPSPLVTAHDADSEKDSFGAKVPRVSEMQEQVLWKGGKFGMVPYVEVCCIELPVRPFVKSRRSSEYTRNCLFLTDNLRRSLRALAFALNQGEPVLIEGPPGSGKTAIIQELAFLTGNSDAIFLHVDEQMDSKTFLGTYVCTEVPGEFLWQPGVLAQAVSNGSWVVFENIDRAPFEILSALVPLLEDRKLCIPGRGETILAAKSFQLLATITRIDGVHSSGQNVLKNLWRKIVFEAPTDSEMEIIIGRLFPTLAALAPKLIGTFNLVNTIALELICSADICSARNLMFGRDFSRRDLIKWCTRISRSMGSCDILQSSSIHESIFREAADCFAACITCLKNRLLVMEALGKLWGVSREQVHFFETLHKPLLQVLHGGIKVGRVWLSGQSVKERIASTRLFANAGHALRNLERLASCVQQQEPVLLVGETGTGKTTLVQYLAELLSMPLTVMNLSQQSDSADFIGGFKPVDAQHICFTLLEKFSDLFSRTFPLESNSNFMARVHQFAAKQKLKQLIRAFEMAVSKVNDLLSSSSKHGEKEDLGTSTLEHKTKRKRPLSNDLTDEWNSFSCELEAWKQQIEASETSFAFSYVEGAFVKAYRHGHWILLDEVNLAPIGTLQRLAGVLEGEHGSLSITERGDLESIPRHSNFRLFACMNPATDVGKHNLPLALKNRFTEFYIDDLTERDDLHNFVNCYLEGSMPCPPVAGIVDFYLHALQESNMRLFDSSNQKPRYSLRSLARALEYTKVAMPIYGFFRALYDGISMTFHSLLDQQSAKFMDHLIFTKLFQSNVSLKIDFQSGKVPKQPSHNHVLVEHFWVECGSYKPSDSSLEFIQKYTITESIREHLKNLAKAVFIRRYPVLLQGPTSSGKTSLIEYLATITGHRFVRINNHEHTDLQEYIGTYITGPTGKLVFQEGILVEALRHGYWIVLDELNLAPSEVLEALNRLLDDNRELFIPELQVTVKPHPQFMLFATQNPPGLYGGRKVLSRAFRSRFLEFHVYDIPENELCTILEKRCEIPRSYAEKMVSVMKDLQRNRQNSQVFAGKHGFITPRDLFRWADRHRKAGTTYEDLARFGYILLAERLREVNERLIVQDVLEKNLRVKINIDTLYDELLPPSKMEKVENGLLSDSATSAVGKIVWTKNMKRLFSLVESCYENNEPMLLVGETGYGKTTVCQALAMFHKQRLHILNCHQHTETSDFLGGFRPVRDRERLARDFERGIVKVNASSLFHNYQADNLNADIRNGKRTLAILGKVLALIRRRSASQSDNTSGLQSMTLLYEELVKLHTDWCSLFCWQDGPLVDAMRKGDLFLVDEISLADDSVLERLNSVLEPKRLLVLAERGSLHIEELVAHPDFLLMATMNPGGDFGKKELSPALRNRFTEIWVPPMLDEEDLKCIVLSRLSRPGLAPLADCLVNFWKWHQSPFSAKKLTIRDLLSWITFINTVEAHVGMYNTLLHGAFLVLLDGMSSEMGSSTGLAKPFKKKCLDFLLEQVPLEEKQGDVKTFMQPTNNFCILGTSVGIEPFFIPRGNWKPTSSSYELMAPTTASNTFRILRAMQLKKPVLIEGSPGVGKTSLVAAIANISGHSLVRINLSEQTDMMDLLGSDLPVEGSEGSDFGWSDGVFLQAIKAGSWVVLDELNLASQSVLEGLNSCLDHRGTVFISELGQSFQCPPSFRVFACQNPSHQGGGRKCLPKSFLNRFTRVSVDLLSEEDFIFISNSLHPSVPQPVLSKLIHFNRRIFEDTMVSRIYGQCGAPWEFNLRDVLRSCSLLEGGKDACLSFLEVVYLQRMRTTSDRQRVLKLYEDVFGIPAHLNGFPGIHLDPKHLQIGFVSIDRVSGMHGQFSKDELTFLPGQIKYLESMMYCVQQGWMCILVGPPACGKTSLVRILSKLTGNSLLEFTLSSGTDTSELLGCFEQHDPFQCWQNLLNRVCCLVHLICTLCLTTLSQRFSVHACVLAAGKLLKEWSALKKSISLESKKSLCNQFSPEMIWKESRVDDFSADLVSSVLCQLESILRTFGEQTSDLYLEAKALISELTELKRLFRSRDSSRHFEWVDGGFLRAVEKGDWVLLENANLCNSTVLDRLNPLLEPNGAIMINERGMVDGSVRVLRAHSNFRLFLTVDPSYGEISRAMRNRGVEIFVMGPSWLIQEPLCTSGQPEKFGDVDEDVKHYLISMGLPGCHLVNSMELAHVEIIHLVKSSCESYPSFRELSNWVHMFIELFEKGGSLLESLKYGWEQIYVQGLEDPHLRVCAFDVFDRHFGKLGDTKISNQQVTLQLPGGWPSPLGITKFCKTSLEMIVIRDCKYMELILGNLVGAQIHAMWSTHVKTSRRDTWYIWLQRYRALAVMFPSFLLQMFLHPLSSQSFQTNDASTQVIEKLNCQVMYSGLWMLEQAHVPFDRGMRLLWLRRVTGKLEQYCSSLVILSKALKTLSESAAFEQLLLELGNLQLSWKPLGRLLLARKLHVLQHTWVQWETENELLEHARMVNFSRIEPVIILSFRWCENLSSLRSSFTASSEMNRVLYPFLMALRKFEEVLLSCNAVAWDKLDRLYYKFGRSHKMLWKIITKLNVDNLTLWCCWKICDVNLKNLFSNLHGISNELEMAMIHLVEVSGQLGSVLVNEVRSLKSYLWKYGGHPHAPHSVELYNLQQSILQFCHSLWPNAVHGGESQVTTGELFRRLTLEGLSMSMWLLRGKIKEELGSSHVSSLSERRLPEEILKKLEERLDIEKTHSWDLFPHFRIPNNVKIPNGYGECRCLPPHFLEKSHHPVVLLEGMNELLKTMSVQWIDSASLRWDEIMCCKVLALLNWGDGCSADLADQVAELRGLILQTIDFSLKFSSRSPLDLVPHQQLLWLIDTCTYGNTDGVLQTKVLMEELRNITHQMWFNWLSATWRTSSLFDLGGISHRWSFVCGPARLFRAIESTFISNIVLQEVQIREYNGKVVFLRLAGEVLWESPRAEPSFDVTCGFVLASSIFCQIVLSFAKTFRVEDFVEIRALLQILHPQMAQNFGRCRKEANIYQLQLLLKNSKDARFVGMVDSHFTPVMEQLYTSTCSDLGSMDSLLLLGKLWLLLGGVHLKLLLSMEPSDPGSKYACQYSLLSDNYADLKLELEVRQDSCLTVRGGSNKMEYLDFEVYLKELEQEISQKNAKMVYRSHPTSISNLYKDIEGFLPLLDAAYGFLRWANDTGAAFLAGSRIQEVIQWQEIAMQFISRLSVDYPDFVDLVQPVQLAVFELKLGLSLLLAAWISEETLVQEGLVWHRCSLNEILCRVMQFPVSAKCVAEATMFDMIEGGAIDAMVNLLHREMGDENTKEGTIRLRVNLFQLGIHRLKTWVLQSRMINAASVKIAIGLMRAVSVFLRGIRILGEGHTKMPEGLIQIKNHTMDIEMDQDEAFLRDIFPDIKAAGEENEDGLQGDEHDGAIFDYHASKPGISGKVWTTVHNVLSREMINLQNELFGLFGMWQETKEYASVSDEERMAGFVLGYDAGSELLKGMPYLMPASVDEQLLPAHILRVSLKHEDLVASSTGTGKQLNIYENPSPKDAAAMLDPLTTLQIRISSCLLEWPDNPVLLQLTAILNALLNMPLHVPIFKALVGIEHLLAKAQLWEENSSKQLSLSDELDALSKLVSKWRKFELEHWRVLLHKVEQQMELGTEKLWLSLYDVLHPMKELSSESDFDAIISSLEEFMQTSALGDYQKRLGVLSGFYGEFYIQRNFDHPPCGFSRPFVDRFSRIIYNVISYYHQFLPTVEDAIAKERKSTEQELDNLVRLSKWDERNYYSLLISTETAHRNVFKLVKKYKVKLGQPVLPLLTGMNNIMDLCALRELNRVLPDIIETREGQVVHRHVKEMFPEKSLLCCLERSMAKLCSTADSDGYVVFGDKSFSAILPIWWKLLKDHFFSENASMLWKSGQAMLDDSLEMSISCAERMKAVNLKLMVKKKALVDLLKSLKAMGLSHHRCAVPKEERTSGFWFQQHPCDVENVLIFGSKVICELDTAFEGVGIGKAHIEDCLASWKRANAYHFKNMYLLHQMHQMSIQFNKDLTLQEVTVATACMEQLFHIEQKQRLFTYKYCLELIAVQNISNQLGSLGTSTDLTIVGRQDTLRKWLWIQKDLIDSLYNTCLETSIYHMKVAAMKRCPDVEEVHLFDSLDKIVKEVAGLLKGCKDNLDNILAPGFNVFSINETEVMWPVLITPEMEELIMSNFLAIVDAKSVCMRLCHQQTCGRIERRFGTSFLFERLHEATEEFKKFKDEKTHATANNNPPSMMQDSLAQSEQLPQFFIEVPFLMQSISTLNSNLDTLSGSSGDGYIITAETLSSLTSGLEDRVSALRLEQIYQAALMAIPLANAANNNCVAVTRYWKSMHELLNLLVAAGLVILLEYISLHDSLVRLGFTFLKTFVLLFHHGFGSKPETEEENKASGTNEISGIGMGEGEGRHDVSHEIENEDQLIGTEEKPKDKNHKSVGSSEEGIEMQDDFECDIFDVSLSQSNEETKENDKDEEQVDSIMGESGEKDNVVDEKLSSKEQETFSGDTEKYESGPGVRSEEADLELRAKEENKMEETADGENSIHDLMSEEERELGDEHVEDTHEPEPFTQNEAYESPSGVAPSISDTSQSDYGSLNDIDEEEDFCADHKEPLEANGDENDTLQSPNDQNEKGKTLSDGMGTEEMVLDERPDTVNEIDSYSLDHASIYAGGQGNSKGIDAVANAELAPAAGNDDLEQESSFKSTAKTEANMMDNDTNAFYNPTEGMSFSKHNLGQNLDIETNTTGTAHRMETNPLRSLGDAFEEWKERVMVKDHPMSIVNDMEIFDKEEQDAFEYQYAMAEQKTTMQALGAATDDQHNQKKRMDGLEETEYMSKEPRGLTDQQNSFTKDEIYNSVQKLEQRTIDNKSIETSKRQASLHEMDLDIEMHDKPGDVEGLSYDRKSYASATAHNREVENFGFGLIPLEQPNIIEIDRLRKELEKKINGGLQNIDMAKLIWAKYEQLTSRLSQELTEQLRLIMEPTFASGLQGDYRTGKRINMRKVIPYIASHFQKDKIWLRRTKPSKREYHVVLAIDDSRSMSESHCGHTALEAMITICRAMSTLEVGKMAVASFGRKGNVKLLHDFDSPFSAETGIQMISHFSFKQDNTIADEPIVDLLGYLTAMLDAVANTATMRSGCSYLQQLILIIADGRFHEKEKLKRCIHEASSKGQMLAFIIVDNFKESIMDVQSVSFSNGAPTFSKYIDTFPFPYYIILKDIEALPWTLADLLRQWFEAAQRFSAG